MLVCEWHFRPKRREALEMYETTSHTLEEVFLEVSPNLQQKFPSNTQRRISNRRLLVIVKVRHTEEMLGRGKIDSLRGERRKRKRAGFRSTKKI